MATQDSTEVAHIFRDLSPNQCTGTATLVEDGVLPTTV